MNTTTKISTIKGIIVLSIIYQYYFIIFLDYLNFQIVTGINVATKKDKNNNDCETNIGKSSAGIINPTSNTTLTTFNCINPHNRTSMR